MRWFDGLRVGSIDSFKELTQAFGSRFITCSRVPWPLDSPLSLSMREGETLKTYSDRAKTLCSMTIDPGPIDHSVLTEQVKHRSELL